MFQELQSVLSTLGIQYKCPRGLHLTKRQYEILFLLCLGCSPKKISAIISEKENKLVCSSTITAIINKHLYRVFKCNTVTDLVHIALSTNLLKKAPRLFNPIHIGDKVYIREGQGINQIATVADICAPNEPYKLVTNNKIYEAFNVELVKGVN